MHWFWLNGKPRNSKYFVLVRVLAPNILFNTPDSSVYQLISNVLHDLHLVCRMSETSKLSSVVVPPWAELRMYFNNQTGQMSHYHYYPAGGDSGVFKQSSDNGLCPTVTSLNECQLQTKPIYLCNYLWTKNDECAQLSIWIWSLVMPLWKLNCHFIWFLVFFLV